LVSWCILVSGHAPSVWFRVQLHAKRANDPLFERARRAAPRIFCPKNRARYSGAFAQSDAAAFDLAFAGWGVGRREGCDEYRDGRYVRIRRRPLVPRFHDGNSEGSLGRREAHASPPLRLRERRGEVANTSRAISESPLGMPSPAHPGAQKCPDLSASEASRC